MGIRMLRRGFRAPDGHQGVGAFLWPKPANTLLDNTPIILGKGARLVEIADGFKIPADAADYASALMIYGRYSTDIVAVLQAIVKPGDRVIDVGGHIGFLTCHLARIVGEGGVVYSFEPDPNALARLREAVLVNQLDQVCIMPIATGEVRGEIEFQAYRDLGFSTAVIRPGEANFTLLKVKSVPLDDLVAEGQVEGPITFVKMDVEGYECSVLDGMRAILDNDRPFVLTEVNPRMLAAAGKSTRQLFARFTERDYRVYAIRPPRGVLVRGRATLWPIDTSRESSFCDALCVPRERDLPGQVEIG